MLRHQTMTAKVCLPAVASSRSQAQRVRTHRHPGRGPAPAHLGQPDGRLRFTADPWPAGHSYDAVLILLRAGRPRDPRSAWGPAHPGMWPSRASTWPEQPLSFNGTVAPAASDATTQTVTPGPAGTAAGPPPWGDTHTDTNGPGSWYPAATLRTPHPRASDHAGHLRRQPPGFTSAHGHSPMATA
jgi:hypothetical protein